MRRNDAPSALRDRPKTDAAPASFRKSRRCRAAIESGEIESGSLGPPIVRWERSQCSFAPEGRKYHCRERCTTAPDGSSCTTQAPRSIASFSDGAIVPIPFRGKTILVDAADRSHRALIAEVFYSDNAGDFRREEDFLGGRAAPTSTKTAYLSKTPL